MGMITIKVPDDINLEYEVGNIKFIKNLIYTLKEIGLNSKFIEKDNLLGLFANETELIDQITESAMQSREDTPFRYNNG